MLLRFAQLLKTQNKVRIFLTLNTVWLFYNPKCFGIWNTLMNTHTFLNPSQVQKFHRYLNFNTQHANYFCSGFCHMPHSWTLSLSYTELNLILEHEKRLWRREAVRGVDAILPSCWVELKTESSFLLGGTTGQAKQSLIWVIKLPTKLKLMTQVTRC